MPTVSVVMSVYNGERYVAEAIESILAQTLTDFEFIIVDDASQDRSSEIIRSYEMRDSRIRALQHDRNLGAAAAFNFGLLQASGEFYARMDHDDISEPQRLQKQVEFLQRNPEIGLVGTHLRCVDHDLNPVPGYKVPLEHPFIVLNLFVGPALHGPTFMVRRRLLAEVGNYNEKTDTNCGDMELPFRLLERTQSRLANLPDALYTYRIHDQQVSTYDSVTMEVKPMPGLVRIRTEALQSLWQTSPGNAVADRFYRMRIGGKLGILERMAAKRDILRLIDSLIARKWVDARERPLLLAGMNRRLEGTTPRLWQRILHWRRYRLGI